MAVKCLALFFVLSYGITFLRGHKLFLARLSCEPTWSPPPRSAVRHQCGLEAERTMEDKRRKRKGSGTVITSRKRLVCRLEAHNATTCSVHIAAIASQACCRISQRIRL